MEKYSSDRLLIDHGIMTRLKQSKTSSIDILAALSKFKKIIGFSSKIPDSLVNSIAELD
jgi:hypothetical protein